MDSDDDVSYPEALVELFVEEFTRPGDLVFDPFAGFGTTLVVAERLGRRALGVELLSERAAYVRSRLNDPAAIVQGDALQLAALGLPSIDLVMTSPPYMNKVDHPQNPLTGYRTLDADYPRFMAQLGAIFGICARHVKADGRVVVSVAQIQTDGVLTDLPGDLADAVAGTLELERRVEVTPDVQPAWMVGDYCLVFRPLRLEANRPI